jgi:diguanylate cyclase (GGDEF)-like protein
MPLTITEYLEKQSKSRLAGLGILLFALIATSDYLIYSHYGFEFSPFYLVPVSFFAWFLGEPAGVACSVIGLSADFFFRLRQVPAPVAYWDAAVWFALYISSTWMIAQLKTLYERERHLSRIDPLTRIDNRRSFFESAARFKNLSDRQQVPMSIAYLDVDGFKELNDRLGHSAGDQVLVMTATELRKAVRPADVVARIGGDEFAVLLPATGEQAAALTLERVRLELDRATQERNWPVTFSIGIVSFFPPLGSVAQMMHAADKAMYAAKRGGKNRTEHRDPAA